MFLSGFQARHSRRRRRSWQLLASCHNEGTPRGRGGRRETKENCIERKREENEATSKLRPAMDLLLQAISFFLFGICSKSNVVGGKGKGKDKLSIKIGRFLGSSSHSALHAHSRLIKENRPKFGQNSADSLWTNVDFPPSLPPFFGFVGKKNEEKQQERPLKQHSLLPLLGIRNRKVRLSRIKRSKGKGLRRWLVNS